MKRTTILADEGLLIEARHLAKQRGTTLTVLVQEALREFITLHRPKRRISFAGIGDSGDPLFAERDEEILAADIDPIEGWSPRRPLFDRSGD